MPDTAKQMPEHRSKIRTKVDFPAVVRGTDHDGHKFQEAGAICNLSAEGLYLRLQHSIEQGMNLFIAFRFASVADQPAMGVAVRGVVRRVEAEPGAIGAGIMFSQHRCLAAAQAGI